MLAYYGHLNYNKTSFEPVMHNSNINTNTEFVTRHVV